jgi:cytochrome c1
MKLFLLNSMENEESNKIGLTFLGFFYHFLEFVFLWQKKKKKNLQ